MWRTIEARKGKTCAKCIIYTVAKKKGFVKEKVMRTHLTFITTSGREFTVPIHTLTLMLRKDAYSVIIPGYRMGGNSANVFEIDEKTYHWLREILLTGSKPIAEEGIRKIRFKNKEDVEIPAFVDFKEVPEQEGCEVRDDWPHARYGQSGGLQALAMTINRTVNSINRTVNTIN